MSSSVENKAALRQNKNALLKSKMRIRFSPGWIFVYTFMLLLVAFTSLPLIYMISTAFKPLDELFLFPPRFIVRKPTLQNFGDLLTALSGTTVPFTRFIFNSTFVSASIVVATVIVSSMGAFALEKHKIPGHRIIFATVIAGIMFSPHVTQIPRYLLVNGLKLIDTYWALIVPNIAVAYNFFLMKQFSSQIPNSLLESARMDAVGEFMIYWKIVMPLLKPAWSTLIVFSFVTNWNDYFTPLIFTQSQAMRTLPLALQTLAGGAGSIGRVGAVAAATFLMTMPTIIIFVTMQRRVMQTMIHSGIKS
ncbi:MAG: carbohydrate ABC transporter permease [Spirochaetales bacterium]|jgi:ABC-type glycerol-3-phosphate transport system permease component|nr:carbohydrate ABC transporter permease [Spirochaetales bacterium]